MTERLGLIPIEIKLNDSTIVLGWRSAATTKNG